MVVCKLVAYKKWSLTRGGRQREVVAYERRSLLRSGRLQEVVGRGELTVVGIKTCQKLITETQFV